MGLKQQNIVIDSDKKCSRETSVFVLIQYSPPVEFLITLNYVRYNLGNDKDDS